jgi:hypothetical protein
MPGWGYLRALAEKHISEQEQQLIKPSFPNEQTLHQVTSLQGEIRGLKWMLERVANLEKQVKGE